MYLSVLEERAVCRRQVDRLVVRTKAVTVLSSPYSVSEIILHGPVRKVGIEDLRCSVISML